MSGTEMLNSFSVQTRVFLRVLGVRNEWGVSFFAAETTVISYGLGWWERARKIARLPSCWIRCRFPQPSCATKQRDEAATPDESGVLQRICRFIQIVHQINQLLPRIRHRSLR